MVFKAIKKEIRRARVARNVPTVIFRPVFGRGLKTTKRLGEAIGGGG